MSSTDLKRLARAIQRDTGDSYTVALRKAKESLKAKASTAPRAAQPSDQNWGTQIRLGAAREAALLRLIEAEADQPELPEFWSPREEFNFNTETGEITLSYGFQRKGLYASLDVEEDYHLLCSGKTGSGKSQLMKNITLAALRDNNTYEVSIIARTAGEYDWAAPYVRGMATDLEDALALVRAVHIEAVTRNEVREMFGAACFTDVEFYLAEDEGVTERRHVLFIEELQGLIAQYPVPPASEDPQRLEEREQVLKENRYRAEIAELLTEIVRVGHFSAVSVVADTHNPLLVQRDLPVFARSSAKILMGQASPLEYALAKIDAEDAPPAEDLEKMGRGVFRSISGNVYTVQVWQKDDESRAQILRNEVDNYLWRYEKFNLKKFRD